MLNGIIEDIQPGMKAPAKVFSPVSTEVNIQAGPGAFLKYNKLKTQFPHTINRPAESQERWGTGRKKMRLIVRKGLEYVVLRLEDVVLIYTQNRIVYVIDRLSKKYIADKNLSGLDEELDNIIFFRANRQYIVNINYIKSYKPYEKVKLLINLAIPEIGHSIVVSQETAPAFKKWMLEA